MPMPEANAPNSLRSSRPVALEAGLRPVLNHAKKLMSDSSEVLIFQTGCQSVELSTRLIIALMLTLLNGPISRLELTIR